MDLSQIGTAFALFWVLVAILGIVVTHRAAQRRRVRAWQKRIGARTMLGEVFARAKIYGEKF